MKVKCVYWILLFLMLSFSVLNGQTKGSDIKIFITGYPDTALIMTTYYGDKVILTDTAFALKDGSFQYKSTTEYNPGIYMAVSPAKVKLFEYVIGTDQYFSLSTDTTDYNGNMKIKGSEENAIFFDYLMTNQKLYSQSVKLSERLKNPNVSDQEKQVLQQRFDSLNQAAADYKFRIIDEHSEMYVAKMFKAMREISIPDSIRAGDSLAAYLYYRKHFFDFIDLSDNWFLYTPLLARKVDQYFDQLVFQHPDSAISAIDRIISLSEPSVEVKSWLLWHFLSKYQNPEFMGFDKVFVHLIDTYFANDELTNLTPSIRQNLIERAEIMRPLLLGSPAPNLILIDTTGKYRSFLSLENDYIILFFWDYDCGVCKTEIASLRDIYLKTDTDFEIFAINVNADLEKWKSQLIEQNFPWENVNGTRSVTRDFHDLYDIHGSPVIFILDRNRNIIAKHLNADQIITFFKSYLTTHE